MNRAEWDGLLQKANEARQANDFQMRSCWNCNPAHEHLKDRGLIVCFECGHWYLNGVDLTALAGEFTP
jgi:hypothetical protein